MEGLCLDVDGFALGSAWDDRRLVQVDLRCQWFLNPGNRHLFITLHPTPEDKEAFVLHVTSFPTVTKFVGAWLRPVRGARRCLIDALCTVHALGVPGSWAGEAMGPHPQVGFFLDVGLRVY